MRVLNKQVPPRHPHSRSQQGITLIELMIALVIGLLATGAMLKVYIDSSQLYRFNESLARIQENGRFATEFIRREARMAGFWGCNQGASLTNLINIAATNHPRYDSSDITGTNGVESNEPNKPDSITFSGAGRNIGTLRNDMATPDSALNVYSTGDFKIGDAVLIGDCETADIFQVTEKTGTAPNLTLKHDTEDNTTAELSKAYTSGSQLYAVRQITFSIASGADPEQFSLYRLTCPALGDCTGKGDELVEGIENMQILFGEDIDANDDGTDSDGTAHRYLPPKALGLDMDKVVSVRIFLLARSLNDNLTTESSPYFFHNQVHTPGDKRLRKEFTTTVALRNQYWMGTDSAGPVERLSWEQLFPSQ